MGQWLRVSKLPEGLSLVSSIYVGGSQLSITLGTRIRHPL